MQALLALAVFTLVLAAKKPQATEDVRLFTALSVPRHRRWPLFVASVVVHCLGILLILQLGEYLFPPRRSEWMRHMLAKGVVIRIPPIVYAPVGGSDLAGPGPAAKPRAARPASVRQQPARQAASRPVPRPFQAPQPRPRPEIAQIVVPPAPRLAASANALRLPSLATAIPRSIDIPEPPSLPSAVGSLRPVIKIGDSFALGGSAIPMPASKPAGGAIGGPGAGGSSSELKTPGFALQGEALDRFQKLMLKAYLFLMSPKEWLAPRFPSPFEEARIESPELAAPMLARMLHPSNGTFDVVVVQSSPSEAFPETGTALSGRPIYTVYLQVGARKEWILQYCIPRAQGVQVSGSVVQLSNPAPVRAPYPWVTYRPPILLQPGSGYILVHGFVDTIGRFKELSVLRGGGPQLRELVLGSLAKWEFRPATRDDRPVLVEILLTIFPDRA
jgi:hypothetical protein